MTGRRSRPEDNIQRAVFEHLAVRGRHGERTKAAIAERRKFSTLLKMLRAGLM
jgi:hypothetical protein